MPEYWGMNKPQPLTVRQIAAHYSLTVETIRNWIKTGVGGQRLKARRIGRRWVVEPQDLEAFVAESSGGTAAGTTPAEWLEQL